MLYKQFKQLYMIKLLKTSGEKNIAQELGIFLDSYFRDFYIMNKFQCLYGRDWYAQPTQGINYPYLDKVMICILNFLLKRGIVKYK